MPEADRAAISAAPVTPDRAGSADVGGGVGVASPGMLPVSRRLGRKSHEDVTKGGGDYRRGLQSCAIHAFAWSQVENRSTGIRQDGRVPRQGVKDPAILWEGDPKPFDPSLMPRTIAGVCIWTRHDQSSTLSATSAGRSPFLINDLRLQAGGY